MGQKAQLSFPATFPSLDTVPGIGADSSPSTDNGALRAQVFRIVR